MIIFLNILLIISGSMFCSADISGDKGFVIWGLMFMLLTPTILFGYFRWVAK